MKKFNAYAAVFVFLMISIGAVIYTPAKQTTKANSSLDIPTPKKVESKSVFEVADSICQEAGVPWELVKEIGQNESGWRCVKNTTGGTDYGDLQVIDPTFWGYYKILNLTGGKTRRNYLKVAIYYLKDEYKKYGSWKKARFAYGRGYWRNESTWTCLEEEFMNKIDWSKYDKS